KKCSPPTEEFIPGVANFKNRIISLLLVLQVLLKQSGLMDDLYLILKSFVMHFHSLELVCFLVVQLLQRLQHFHNEVLLQLPLPSVLEISQLHLSKDSPAESNDHLVLIFLEVLVRLG